MSTQDGIVRKTSLQGFESLVTCQSSEHFLVTPTVSFNLTTPVVFFRFFMQPRNAGVEILNLNRDSETEKRCFTSGMPVIWGQEQCSLSPLIQKHVRILWFYDLMGFQSCYFFRC